MNRITIMLMGAGALALAACSGGGGGNDVAANTAGENATANVMFDEANNLGNVAEAPAGAEEEGNATAATPAAPADPTPAARRPNAAPKAAPAPRPERPKVAPRPEPTPEPSPPPKAECTPEHRAAGHC